jgi:hypothetical protein
MALPGDTTEVACFLIVSALLVAAIALLRDTPLRTRLVLCGIYGAFLFVALKAGFIRHDSHALIAAQSLLVAGMVFAGTQRSWPRFAVVVVAGATWFYIDNHYMDSPLEQLATDFAATYSSTRDGIADRLSDDGPAAEFDRRMNKWARVFGVARFEGTTDIYSNAQTVLFASGNTWSPRPVFQSYAVYSEYLNDKNRAHLLGPTAPDNILYRIEPIDARFPPLEDGGSWPLLLTRYEAVGPERGWLKLHKRAQPLAMPEPVEIETSKHWLGKKVAVPDVDALLFAEIEIDPSIPGSLAGALFKRPPLLITLDLANGQHRTYRWIPSMGKLGVLISPVVENTLDLARLFGGTAYLGAKKVESFTIEPDGSMRWWQHGYRVTWKRMDLKASFDVRRFQQVDEPFAGNVELGSAEHCDGVVDQIDGRIAPPVELWARGVIEIAGWMVISRTPAAFPDGIALVLTDADGNHTVFHTRKVLRNDVATYFKDQRFGGSGFGAVLDLTKLEGKYTLAIALQSHDKIDVCSQYQFLVHVGAAH